MFKVLITAINPVAKPLKHGGLSALIPDLIADGGDRSADITISIESTKPWRKGNTTYTGKDSSLIAEWISSRCGMYGHLLGNHPAPSDLIAVLHTTTWLEWEIIEGADILMISDKLPKGAIG